MALDKLVDSTQLNTDLTAVANAIRTKGDTSAALAFPQGFVDAVEAIETGGGGIYERLITNDPPVVTLVDNDITSLYGWSMPSAVTVVLPNLTAMGTVNGKTLLKTMVAPLLQTVETRQFYNCSNLVDVWCPLMQGATATGLTSMQRHFAACKKIKHLYLSAWEYMGYCSIDDNTALESLTFDDIVQVSALGKATSLAALIIRNTSATLYNSGSLQYTLIASGTGYIYVPASAVNTYKAATNWATYASQIIGIDEDTTGTVGTAFTPTATATGIVSWDKIDLQSYSVGTVDASTGAITPAHDGRCLIRGFDTNDNIVHVTYLNVGAGFDWEAIA